MNKPVFIYSSWRTASTWVWKKFRDCSAAYAYYEPYHEVLAEASIDYLSTRAPGNWNTRSNHPDSAPYFLEFIPLLKSEGKGIYGYDSRMGIPSMFPDIESPLSVSESDYLARLVNLAESQGRVPVFACTRNLGRVSSTAKSFPTGVHIVTIRNLWHQWMSYCSQAEQGSSYFLETIRTILNECDDDVVIARMKGLFNVAEFRGNMADVSIWPLFYAFIGIHLTLYCRAFMRADVVVDINRMERDPVYRSQISNQVRNLTGLPVNFDDVRCQIEYGSTPIPTEEDLRIRIPLLMSLVFNGYRIEQNSPIRDHLKRLCDELIDEIRAYDFYTKALSRSFAQFRLFHDGRTGEWAVTKKSLKDANEALTEERNHLTKNLLRQENAFNIAEAEARACREEQGKEIARLKQQEDVLKRAEAEARACREEQDKEVARLKQQEDVLKRAEAEARACREEQDKEIVRLKQQEDVLKRAEAEARACREEQDNEIARLKQQEDSLRRADEGARVCREEQAQEITLLKEECIRLDALVSVQTEQLGDLFVEADRLRQSAYRVSAHTHLYRAWRRLVGDARYTPLNKNMKRYSNNNVTWHTHLYRAWLALFIPSDRVWHTYVWRAWRSLLGDAKYTPSLNGRNSGSSTVPLVEPTVVQPCPEPTVVLPCRVPSDSLPPALNAILETISIINDRQVRIDADRANLERSVPVALREMARKQNELERRLAALESNLLKN